MVFVATNMASRQSALRIVAEHSIVKKAVQGKVLETKMGKPKLRWQRIKQTANAL
jgi:hypothetical protein